MEAIQPSAEAREARELARRRLAEAQEFRGQAEAQALSIEGHLERNHFADKLKAIIYGRDT